MWFLYVDSILSETIDDLKVLLEHVWMLVIFAGDVLLDGIGKINAVGFAKGQREDVGAKRVLVFACGIANKIV